MPRYLMTLCYDGSAYVGWQKQHNGLGIQQVVEKALSLMKAPNPSVTAAGRTDAGVHAIAQKAHFDYPARMPVSSMIKALNSLLSYDIKVMDITPVPDSFHARFDACQRSYRYLLAKESHPFRRLYRGFIPHKPIRFKQMQSYIPALLGKKDFSSLAQLNPNIPNRICDLQRLELQDMGDHLVFEFTADRFLHNMVRRIVGTMLNLAAKDLPIQELKKIIDMQDPRQTLVETAPANGLYLTQVKYPEEKLSFEDLK